MRLASLVILPEGIEPGRLVSSPSSPIPRAGHRASTLIPATTNLLHPF
jgi:hypothetical protein